MKKLIAAMAVLFAATMVSYAGPTNVLTGEAVDAVYVLELDTTISDGVFDTLNGTSDSTFLLRDWRPEPGWEWLLAWSPNTDGGTGAPEFILRTRCEDEDGDLLYYDETGDTLGNSGGFMDLEIGESLIGYQFDLIVDGGAANGAAAHLLNQVKLFKRRPVCGNQIRYR